MIGQLSAECRDRTVQSCWRMPCVHQARCLRATHSAMAPVGCAPASVWSASWADVSTGPPLARAVRLGPRVRQHPFCCEAAMTDTIEPPQDDQHTGPREETRSDPVETPLAMQQLRAAGFSDDQQAALTTALLRVLALWTQQATRGDVQAEHQALAQRLASQLDARQEDLRRDI